MIRTKNKRQRLNEKTKKFIKHVKEHLAKYNMKLVWGRGEFVQCGGYTSNAYFSEGDGVIKVARKNPYWLESLVHEYGHFLQWINRSPIYKNSHNAILNIDKWFQRENIAKNRLKKSFTVVREMERECEILACKLSKQYQLPINRRGYARRANVYIYSHWIMEQQQKFWAFRRDPMSSRYILSLMPANFRVHAHRKIPTKIQKALEGYLH